jgi:hypothetical protein
MRSIILSVLSIVMFSATPAMAGGIDVDDVKVARTLDGNWTLCTNKAHVNQTGWALQNAKVEGTGAQKVRVSGKAVFLRCIVNENAEEGSDESPVKWIRGNPHDKTRKTTAKGEKFEAWIEKVEMVLVNEMIKILTIDSANGADQIEFSQEIATDKLLSPVDLFNLEDGQTVQGRIRTVPRGIVQIKLEGKEAQSMGLRAWGSYTLLFNLKKNGEALLVEAL